MKYSVIICYRDREEHLKILAPRLKEMFGDDAEIIVVEQDNQNKFVRGTLFNVGAQVAKGDILVFTDVDHYPVDVDYDPPEGVDVWLPIKTVEYVNNDLTLKKLEDVPSGYRHFKDGVDDNFFGGCIVFRKDAFFMINGFNSAYNGWGLEDADLRERISYHGLKAVRGGGSFYALDHKDNNPGIQDADFQRNTQIFSRWRDFLEAGVNTQSQTVREVEPAVDGVDRWVMADNFITVRADVIPFMSFDRVAELYEDVPQRHSDIWLLFKQLVNEYSTLKKHRDWVVQNRWGYGNRALHWMWYLIFKDVMPENFKALEIGIYMGQTISLWSILNKMFQKNGTVYALGPLTNAGDAFSKHHDIDYEWAVQTIYATFGLDASDLKVIQGLSNEPDIIESAKQQGPYDLLYIDGCHDYPVVINDIEHYTKMVKVGGLVVIDDVNNYLNIPNGLIRMNWKGIIDVSNAARDTIEKYDNFEELFAVGHNRIWRRTK